MLRILHVISGLGSGGAQRVLARLISATSDRWAHEIVSLADTDDRSFEARPHASVHGLNIRDVVSAWRTVPRVRRIVQRFQPGVIQGWMYHGNLLALGCGIVTRVPVVWNIRHSPESGEHNSHSTRVVIGANVLLSRWVPATVFNSARSLQVHQRMGFRSRQSCVIANGFDTLQFAPNDLRRQRWREEKRIPPSAFVIGHAARFHPIKNHSGALRAFAALAANCPDVWMIMVGEGVDDNVELRRIAASPSCHGRVILVGEHADMVGFYNAVDTLLLSSWAEALPNVLGEAMACGKACVSTDVGDAATLIGDTGWVVADASDEELLRGMREAWASHRATLDQKGCAARLRITQEFSLARMVDGYARLYGAVTAPSDPVAA